MAESINCPQCQAVLQLPEVVIGQDVRCPSCQNVFMAQMAPAKPGPPPQEKPRGEHKSPDTVRPLGGIDARSSHQPGRDEVDEDYPRQCVPSIIANAPAHEYKYRERSGLIFGLGLVSVVSLGLIGAAYVAMYFGNKSANLAPAIAELIFFLLLSIGCLLCALICGLIGTDLGFHDLAQIERGERDPSGKRRTLIGAICSTISLVVLALLFVGICVTCSGLTSGPRRKGDARLQGDREEVRSPGINRSLPSCDVCFIGRAV
jgi:hypothetical protein